MKGKLQKISSRYKYFSHTVFQLVKIFRRKADTITQYFSNPNSYSKMQIHSLLTLADHTEKYGRDLKWHLSYFTLAFLLPDWKVQEEMGKSLMVHSWNATFIITNPRSHRLRNNLSYRWKECNRKLSHSMQVIGSKTKIRGGKHMACTSNRRSRNQLENKQLNKKMQLPPGLHMSYLRRNHIEILNKQQ